MQARSFRFGRFILSVATRELRDGATLVDLPARAFDCLAYLIEHRDRAVGRDELIAAVWGRADVSEALLNHTILKIRRVLGDHASWIRTVPRFGYRWVADIEECEEVAQGPAGAGIASPRAQGSGEEPSGSPGSRRRAWIVPLLAAVVLALIVGLAAMLVRERSRRPVTVTATASRSAASQVATAPAMVLPAEIDAPDDWSWLRLGMMDLVATRLRAGDLRTAPSESVVGLLSQRPAESADALLHDATLASAASLRISPRARLENGRWSVRIDALGAQRELHVEADAADPIAAARAAADRLLGKLGLAARAAGTANLPPALDDLLQRSGAAMLADRLDDARALIERAAPELRDAPAVQQRLAQIELRAGEYDAVERRVSALLDRLPASADPALHARALITLAASYVRRDEYDKADEAYAEAIALRGDAKDPEALGVAYLGHGIVLAKKSRFDDAAAELGRARIELQTAGDPLGIAAVDVNLADFQVMRHRPADALPMLKAAAQRFADIGAREGRVYALIETAGVQHDLIDPAAALATTAEMWPPEAHTSNPRMRWRAVLARAAALADNGRLGDAQALVVRIRTESDPKRDGVLRLQNEALAARIAMRRGNPADAVRLADAALAPGLREADDTLFARTLLLKARALRATGRTAQAAEPTRALDELAASTDDAGFRVYATLADAEQAWARGDRDQGLGGFAAALAGAEHLNVPEERIAVAAPYIAALIEAGHLDEAQAVAGRIAPWADRDLRAARAEADLFRALGRPDAAQTAAAAAARLAGDATAANAGDPR